MGRREERWRRINRGGGKGGRIEREENGRGEGVRKNVEEERRRK